MTRATRIFLISVFVVEVLTCALAQKAVVRRNTETLPFEQGRAPANRRREV